MNHVTKNLWLLGSTVVICCLIYPLAVWAIGQTFFPFTANGSIVNGPDMFFENFSKEYPGKFPSAVTTQLPGGKSATAIEPVASGSDVQSILFACGDRTMRMPTLLMFPATWLLPRDPVSIRTSHPTMRSTSLIASLQSGRPIQSETLRRCARKSITYCKPILSHRRTDS